MPNQEHTTIPVKPDTADELYKDKRRGETWDEFIRRLANEGAGRGADS